MPGSLKTPKGQIAVATTVMLTFISFWRAAAIVLNDMGSSAYYVPGIAEQAIGKAAPWFLLGVMCFSYVVRLVYMESTMIFMRGGMYPVVRSTLGGTLAKLSVSALLFDFILTGPISTVSAGQYIVGLLNQISNHFGGPAIPQNVSAVFFGCVIILYFWWQNIRGIEESSGKALKIMQFITVMVVILVVWGLYSLTQVAWSLPPFQPQLMAHSVGWLPDFNIPLDHIGILIAVGSGHCFLAMSGQETFAQVSREIAHPKLKNLKRAGLIIFIFCFVFMVAVAFFATLLIPDEVRPNFYDNLIIGVVGYFTGPEWMKIAFQTMVVVAGFLILAGASNTALIGSNSIVNAVCEDGVLTDWFRKPHARYGTTYRIINSVALLQIATILLSRGDVYLLGEAYAFGVLWSFVFETLAVIVLRYKRPEEREWKFPVNLHLGKVEIPLGLLFTFFVLLSVSVTNLFTKQVATISGIAFTLLLFTIFAFSEAHRKRKMAGAPVGLDPFRIHANPRINRATVGCKPHNILVPVVESKDLAHLNAVLEETNTKEKDVVVMTVRLLKGPPLGVEREEDIFTDEIQGLFTRAVKLAEKHGKSVHLVVAASNDTFFSIAQTAFKLDSEVVVLRVSHNYTPLQQAKALSDAWDTLPNPLKKDVMIRVWRDGKYILDWNALPPLPDISRETLRGINYLYRELNPEEGGEEISRSRVIEMAVEHMVEEYKTGQFVRPTDQPPHLKTTK